MCTLPLLYKAVRVMGDSSLLSARTPISLQSQPQPLEIHCHVTL